MVGELKRSKNLGQSIGNILQNIGQKGSDFYANPMVQRGFETVGKAAGTVIPIPIVVPSTRNVFFFAVYCYKTIACKQTISHSSYALRNRNACKRCTSFKCSILYCRYTITNCHILNIRTIMKCSFLNVGTTCYSYTL